MVVVDGATTTEESSHDVSAMNAVGASGAIIAEHLVGGSALALVSKMSRSNLSSLSNVSFLKERKDVCSLLSCCSGVQTSSRTGIRGDWEWAEKWVDDTLAMTSTGGGGGGGVRQEVWRNDTPEIKSNWETRDA